MAARTRDRLMEALHQLPAGWTRHYYAATTSTQDEARAAALAGAPDRSIFIADYQLAGRGRAGRAWLASPGSALLLSVVLRESAEALTPWRSTALASVAMAEAISAVRPGVQPQIKWPNDLLLDGRKLAGVLAEAMTNGRTQTVVVGVGVNVNSSPEELAAVGAPATSLRVASGQLSDRGDLLLAFVERVEAWRRRPEAELRRSWEERLWGRGQLLQLMEGSTPIEVLVLGAEADGALRVRLPDGTERTSYTAELGYSGGGMRR
jgi:BirA family biotin operon repressor/biotin-[acetyl-CoA-carboxylase] ligase